MSELQNILFKAFLVLVTAPAWWPFLKAVWEEFNEAMADEGGIFGRAPSPLELGEIRERQLDAEDPLVHEPWPSADARTAQRQLSGARQASGARQGRPQAAPRRPTGFR
jgi:hypothetical protein